MIQVISKKMKKASRYYTQVVRPAEKGMEKAADITRKRAPGKRDGPPLNRTVKKRGGRS